MSWIWIIVIILIVMIVVLVVAYFLGANTTWLLVIGGVFFFIIIIAMVLAFTETPKKPMPQPMQQPLTVIQTPTEHHYDVYHEHNPDVQPAVQPVAEPMSPPPGVNQYFTTHVHHATPGNVIDDYGETEWTAAPQDVPSVVASARPENRFIVNRPAYTSSVPDGTTRITRQQLGPHTVNPDPTSTAYVSPGRVTRERLVDNQGRVISAVVKQPPVVTKVTENLPEQAVYPYGPGRSIPPGMTAYVNAQTGQRFYAK